MKNTGECIYHINLCSYLPKNLQDLLIDPDLASGFFSAIFSFAKMMTGNEDAIKYLPMSNFYYYFFRDQGFIFIFETETIMKKLDFEQLLKEISTIFLEFLKEKNLSIDSSYFIEDENLSNQLRNKISKFIRQNLFKKS